MKKWFILVNILVIILLATGCTIISPPQAGRLEIVSHEMTEVDQGVEVRVTVKNIGLYKVDFAEVAVEFYDGMGDLVKIEKDAIINLMPDEDWTFVIACASDGCEEIESYDIEAVAGTSAGIK